MAETTLYLRGKAAVTVNEDGGGSVYEVDVIELDGRLSLVPAWLETSDGKHSAPERTIPTDQFQTREMPGLEPSLVVLPILPRELLFGGETEAKASGYEVRVNVSSPHAEPDH